MQISENTIEKHIGKAIRLLMAAVADGAISRFREDSTPDSLLRRAARIE